MAEKNDKPRTLVVLGAGASVAPYPQKGLDMAAWIEYSDEAWLAATPDRRALASEYKNLIKHAPPLTANLVDSLQPYSEGCSSLLEMIDIQANQVTKSGKTFDFEHTLKLIYDSSNDELNREFLALRKAIAKRMRKSDAIGEAVSTLYTRLFSTFRISPASRDREFLVVNMNYDRLAELAANNKEPYANIKWYVDENRKINMFHPHGNCGWAVFPNKLPTLSGVQLPMKNNESNLIRVMEPSHLKPVHPTPAIAVPMYGDVNGKTVWPKDHADYLESKLQFVDNIIVIGWRGADEEIVELVSTHVDPKLVTEMHLVGLNPHGTGEMADNLKSWVDGSDAEIKKIEGGFLGYIENDNSPLHQLYPPLET